jgi:hypothetical protein
MFRLTSARGGPWKVGGEVESIIRTFWAILGSKAGFFDLIIGHMAPKSGFWPDPNPDSGRRSGQRPVWNPDILETIKKNSTDGG